MSVSSSLVESAPNSTYAFVAAFMESLSTQVSHVCVSPGSRSTPLAVVAAQQPGLKTWVHVDERSSAFFALGLARASRSPVALVCTSGTAAANYLPAIVEANHARVPLVVLTADRPPELRDWDAGQTIDQLKLYGDQVRWFAEVPVPGDDHALLRYARSLGARAASEALGQGGAPGPVHLNWPLREPLEPRVGVRGAYRVDRSVHATAHRPQASPTHEIVDDLAALTRESERGVIVCGPLDEAPGVGRAIERLARAAGWPVLADAASNLRAGGPEIVANGDFLLRDDAFAEAHAPDLVLRFGSTPVSKVLRLWLERRPPSEYVVVDPYGGFSDPSHLATCVLAVDPERLCNRVAQALPPRESENWLEGWGHADARAAKAIAATFDADDRLLEPCAVDALCEALPEDALLYVSNSMPIRHLDACLQRGNRRVRVLVNRGANGIDGATSSALGAAAADVGQTVLLTGDLAFVHDLGGLLAAARHGLRLTVVVLDNDGGGIFSFLPIAEHGESVDFEELFRTAHGLDLSHAARLFGAGYHRATSLAHYRTALKEAFASDGLQVVHVPTDRDASIAQFRALVAAVAST